MKNTKDIFILGPNLNKYFLRLLVIFRRPKMILQDSYIPQRSSILDCEKFYWNKHNPNLKLKLLSLSLEILDNINFPSKSNLNRLFLNNNINSTLYKDIERKVYLEKIVYLLLILGIASIFRSKGRINIILPSSYKLLYKNILNYLNKYDNKHNLLNSNIKPVFLGINFFGNFKNYLKSLAIVFYFLTKIKRIRKSNLKKYKIGLLTWSTALEIDDNNIKEGTGLNAVIPKNFNPKEVLIYSKTNISKKYQLKAKNNNYDFVDFSKKGIFKYSSFNDILNLLKFFINLKYKFILDGLSPDPLLVDEYPKIIYFYLQWNKFVNTYYFDISISYNEYSLSDLIRNKVFLTKNIKCWSYAHSASDYYLYNSEFSSDPSKSFISYSRKYFLLKDQINFFRSSKVYSEKNILVGPLFKTYKSGLLLTKTNQKKIIISIFPCSINSNSFNPISAEKKFFEELFTLISKSSDEYFYIIKGKSNKFNKDNYKNLIEVEDSICKKENNYVFISPNTPSFKIINKSDLIISMAFTSPTIEALSTGKPAVFFDPQRSANNNHFKKINGIYINNIIDLANFIESIKDKKTLIKWLSVTKEKIGLDENNEGIYNIHKDIEDFFVKDKNVIK